MARLSQPIVAGVDRRQKLYSSCLATLIGKSKATLVVVSLSGAFEQKTLLTSYIAPAYPSVQLYDGRVAT